MRSGKDFLTGGPNDIKSEHNVESLDSQDIKAEPEAGLEAESIQTHALVSIAVVVHHPPHSAVREHEKNSLWIRIHRLGTGCFQVHVPTVHVHLCAHVFMCLSVFLSVCVCMCVCGLVI